MKVFVVNGREERWAKYEEQNTENLWHYERWKGKPRDEYDLDFINGDMNFYWNCNDELRQRVYACFDSHITLIKHIADNRINEAVVIEDDSLFDFSRVKELQEIQGFCYVGGRFQSPILSKKLQTETIKPTKGLNTIDPATFILTGGHGYYFPQWQDAQMIYDDIQTRTCWKKKRAIDVEFKRLQKSKVITQYLYPALSTMYHEHATQGFTYNKNRYKLKLNSDEYEL